MSHNAEISHDGRVVNKENGKLLVKIISRSACGKCHAKGFCSAADMAEKFIDVITYENFRVGDEVRVIMEERLGWMAMFYSFFLPFLVMTSVLFLTYAVSGKETSAGLFAIGSLIPYFFVLYMFRKKFEKNFIFRIERKIKNR